MRLSGIILCVVLPILTACNNIYTYQKNENLPQLRAEWEREYAAWQELGIQDYQFIYSDEIGSGGKITVKDGSFREVTGHGGPGDAPYKTIDELFTVIARGFDSDDGDHHPEQVRTAYTVRYHPEYHYPEYYSIILVMGTSGWVGNGWSFDVSKFSRLEDLEEETWQPNENMPQLLADWEREFEAWKNLNIQNYQFVLEECYNPDYRVYWKYRTQLTVKNGYGTESVGLYPDGFMGGATWRIDEIFTHFIDSRFMQEIYYGWDNWPKIGMYFITEYDPVYHYPAYFEYGYIYDDSTLSAWWPAGPIFEYSIRVSEFTIP